jgi:hypothetical protein
MMRQKAVLLVALTAFSVSGVMAAERNYSVALLDTGTPKAVPEAHPNLLKPRVRVANYQCGAYNDPYSTTCADNQRCCRNYQASQPYNYCCYGECGTFGNCR